MNTSTQAQDVRTTFRFVALLFLVISSCLTTALAQGTGSITGNVSDAQNGQFLVGARVRVDGTDLVTSTDSMGNYRVTMVPIGEHTLSVSYLGRMDSSGSVLVRGNETATVNFNLNSEVVVLEEYKVSSYAEQQVVALNRQRQSNRISNIISADTIGALPDENLRMALNRLPGINIAGGDDGQVSIRGMEGKLNSVVLDGNPLPSAAVNMTGCANQGSTRSLDLMMIPAEAIQGIEVIKTPTADMDGDAIGGRVDLKTASALEFPHRIMRATASARAYSYGGNGYSSGITFGDTLNAEKSVGVFFTANWKDYSREFGQPNLSYVNPEGAYTGAAPILNEINPNYQYEEVEELAMNGTVDWKITPSTRLSFKGWYTHSNKLDQRPRVQLFIRDISASHLTSSNGETAAGNSRIRVRKRQRYRPDREFDQYRVGVTGETVLANSIFNYGVLVGNSTFTGSEYDYRFEANSSSVPYTLDRTGSREFPMVAFNAGSVDLYNNAALYSRQETTYKTRDNLDEDLTMNADWTLDLGTAIPVKLKAGVKGRYKNRVNNNVVRIYSPTSAVTVAAIGKTGQFSVYDRYQELGFMVDDNAFVEFFKANQSNAAFYAENVVAGSREEAEAQQDVQEDIIAGYLMGTVQLTSKLTLIGGLRYEHTDAAYTWAASRSSRGTRNYPDVVKEITYGTPVPSALGVYRFSEKDILRFGWSKTLARPDWNTLVPVDQSITLAVADPSQLTGSATIPVLIRNPDLKPQQADNLDLAFEHYYGPSNLVSFGGFYKKMDNYIGAPISRLSDIQATNPLTGALLFTSGGVPIKYRISRQENGVQQTVKGIEAVWQHRFLGLPGLLSGFGVNTNFAYVIGSRKAPQFLNPANTMEVTGHITYDQLESQPERILHAQVYWERRGFSARIGYTHTSDQITEFDRDGNSDYIRAASRSFDATLSYEFSNGWKIFIEGNNLTGEPTDVRYYENMNYVATYDQDGKRWSAGISAKF